MRRKKVSGQAALWPSPDKGFNTFEPKQTSFEIGVGGYTGGRLLTVEIM